VKSASHAGEVEHGWTSEVRSPFLSYAYRQVPLTREICVRNLSTSLRHQQSLV